jgi:hypothetical protein
VETAIPAFIGYTEKATDKIQGDLHLVFKRILSFNEYLQFFGLPESETIEMVVSGSASTGFKVDSFTPPPLTHFLYYSVKMYFSNGGGPCGIVSAGNSPSSASKEDLLKGLAVTKLQDEPTLLVVPDAVNLGYADFAEVTQTELSQCGELQDRFAILDVWHGDLNPDATVPISANPIRTKQVIEASRDAWSSDLKFGAAYYPYLKSALNYYIFLKEDESASNVRVTHNGKKNDLATYKTTNKSLFDFVRTALKQYFVMLPPSGAVAGVYAATDSARGVWKAPANVPLVDVIEPVVKLGNATQEGLNVDPSTGKSINVIRFFQGKGTLIWGARTLAGNDNEWRYISVRRFFNMIEESVKKSSGWVIFEPNDANTWIKLRSQIENYLAAKWRAGALAGATTKEAFFVACGVGTTMTSQDIHEGRLVVEIGMAVVRPAEFIILKFSHKMMAS